VRSWVDEVAHAAGLGHATTRQLRHTALTMANDATGDLRAVHEFTRHARREQAARRAALVAEVDAAIALVGWGQTRPHVVAVLGASVPLSGPRGRWRGVLRVRTTRRLLMLLDQLSAQPHLPLYSPGPAL